MSQVSYGTITITDTTDIESIYMIYKGGDTNTNAPSINWINGQVDWKTDITEVEGNYIWAITVYKKTGIEITQQNYQDYFSDPVCLTGSLGRGVRLIKTFYCNYGSGEPAEDYSGWEINVPEYDSSKPNYWVKTEIIYVDSTEKEVSKSGDIVTIDNAEGLIEVMSAKVALDPIQSGSGTPSPDNVRPIRGRTEVVTQRTGKNLIDDSKRFAAASTTVYVGAESNAYPIALKAGTYTVSVDFSGELYGLYYREQNDVSGRTIWSSGTNVTERTFTVEEDGAFRFWVYRNATSGGVDPTKVIHLQLELGTTATAYEPYQGDTYTTTLGQTVYGGTLDVVSGELVVDRAMVDLGTLTWGTVESGLYYATPTNIATVITPPYENRAKGAICSIYPPDQQYSTTPSSRTDKTWLRNSNYIYIKDTSYTDATAFKSAVSGAQLVYELAQPQTIQLTPQEVDLLLGDNNVWSDGSLIVSGFTVADRDIKIYKDNGLTDALTKATTALTTASSTEIAQQALANKLRKIWINEVTNGSYLAGTYAASGLTNGADSGFNITNPETYGFNSLLRHTYLSFRYNTHQLVTIGTGADSTVSGIVINTPVVNNQNVITGVKKGIELTNEALKFYQQINNVDRVVTQIGTSGIFMNPNGIIGTNSTVEGFFIEKADNNTVGMGFRERATASHAAVATNYSFAIGGEASFGVEEYGSTIDAVQGSVIEIPTQATGKFSFAQGSGARALHDFSTAIGEGVVTGRGSQLVIGKWNKADTDAIFIIGNGSGEQVTNDYNVEGVTADEGRSNLLLVTNSGDLKIKDGFKIINDNNNYIQLDSDSMDIYQDDNGTSIKVATFGADGTQIGKSDGAHIDITPSSIQMKADYDLKALTINETLYSERVYRSTQSASETTQLIVNIPSDHVIQRNSIITLNWLNQNANFTYGEADEIVSDHVIFNYDGEKTIVSTTDNPTSELITYSYSRMRIHDEFIFGEYLDENITGENVIVFSPDKTAIIKGNSSGVFGNAKVYSDASYAFNSGQAGSPDKYTGLSMFACNSGIVQGNSSFACNHGEANANNSFAAGYYTASKYDNQFVIGQFNKNEENNVFEIGNGSDTTTGANNAFAVDWNGNIYSSGDLYPGDEIYLKNLSFIRQKNRQGEYLRVFGMNAADQLIIGHNSISKIVVEGNIIELEATGGIDIDGDTSILGDTKVNGTIEIQKSTVATNTYADANPKLKFLNESGSQNISLTFTDYDSIQSPASLTLNGNQGGEYFIAPNIKATGNFYGTLSGTATKANQDGSGNTITSTYLKLSGGTMTGNLTLTWGKSLNLGYGSTAIYGGSYNDTRNIYYNAPTADSYHAFYAGGNAVFYIYPDKIQPNKSFTSLSTTGKLTVSSGGASITGAVTTSTTFTGGGTVYSTGNTMCTKDNAQWCGNSDHRWKGVYAVDTSINTSDRKEKDILGSINFAKNLIMSLEPIQYMWKAGDHRRKRLGFIAQDVAQICKNLNENLSLVTASYGHEGEENEVPYYGEDVDDNLLRWGMSYEQLIAPIVQVIQDQQKEIDQLKKEVAQLKK